jgi:uncharacterized protein (DUF952 family)
MTRVYKILNRGEWIEAADAGAFGGSGIDHRDGYIHLSTAAQAGETARLHFAGRDDLVLAAWNAEDLGPALKWESSRGGQLFPHCYGPMDTRAVLEVRPLPLSAAGWPDPGPLEP